MATNIVLFPGHNQALRRVAQQLDAHPGVAIVLSGNAALWQIRRLRPEVVVSDTELPDMQAIDLMEIAMLMVPNARFVFCGAESLDLLQFIEGTQGQLIPLGAPVDQQVWQVYMAMGLRPPERRPATQPAEAGAPPGQRAGRGAVEVPARAPQPPQRRPAAAQPQLSPRAAGPQQAPAEWMPRAAAHVVDVEQMGTIQKLLEGLAAEVAAQSVLLLDTSGMRLSDVGVAPPVLAHAIGPLLATSFSTEAELARLLQDQDSSALHLYEGARYEVFAFNVGERYILTIIFDKQVAGVKVGSVWIFAKRTTRQLQAILEK